MIIEHRFFFYMICLYKNKQQHTHNTLRNVLKSICNVNCDSHPYKVLSSKITHHFAYYIVFNEKNIKIQSCIKFITQKLIFNLLYILPVHWVNRWEKKIFSLMTSTVWTEIYIIFICLGWWIFMYLILNVIYLQWMTHKLQWVFLFINVVQRRLRFCFHYRLFKSLNVEIVDAYWRYSSRIRQE